MKLMPDAELLSLTKVIVGVLSVAPWFPGGEVPNKSDYIYCMSYITRKPVSAFFSLVNIKIRLLLFSI